MRAWLLISLYYNILCYVNHYGELAGDRAFSCKRWSCESQPMYPIQCDLPRIVNVYRCSSPRIVGSTGGIPTRSLISDMLCFHADRMIDKGKGSFWHDTSSRYSRHIFALCAFAAQSGLHCRHSASFMVSSSHAR